MSQIQRFLEYLSNHSWVKNMKQSLNSFIKKEIKRKNKNDLDQIEKN
jgi:hypothetical protein